MFEKLEKTFKGKRVFLTGHTGFKGAWMLQVLHLLGAEVVGYSLAPKSKEDLYCQIDGDMYCQKSIIADICNINKLKSSILACKPHFVFHLAAQSLVIPSYANPIETFTTNTLGTANILEAIRVINEPTVAVMITTDKVYENNEKGVPFKEEDKLGGYDPYSASKAASEIVISSYQHSFFNIDEHYKHQKSIASVRAGNVIGGGDWSDNRIIPDIIKAIEANKNVILRNPNAVRPWQHVLEPIFAYLLLASKMEEAPNDLCTSFNIGPEKEDEKTVLELVQMFLKVFGKQEQYEIQQDKNRLHEAQLLMLDNSKLKQALNWQPKLTAEQAIIWTAEWYENKSTGAHTKCKNQIMQYLKIY